MVSDSIQELDAMAEKIGLKKDWIQVGGSGVIHYDLRESKRNLAVANGAQEVTSAQMLAIGKMCKK